MMQDARTFLKHMHAASDDVVQVQVLKEQASCNGKYFTAYLACQIHLAYVASWI
jgi:CHASE3 domain sensor protein